MSEAIFAWHKLHTHKATAKAWSCHHAFHLHDVLCCLSAFNLHKFYIVDMEQAHDTSVRAMIWSHNDTWMLTADHGGYVKYWQSNMNNVKMYQAHKEPIRGLRWASAKSVKHCQNHSDIRLTLLHLPENMFLLTVSLVTLSTAVEYNRILTLFMIICLLFVSSSNYLLIKGHLHLRYFMFQM